MCDKELKIWIDHIKENADALYKTNEQEGYICEIFLKRIETIVQQLKYEKTIEPSDESE